MLKLFLDMETTEIKLYKSIQAKLGDQETQDLISYIKYEINTEFMECKKVFLIKEDKIDLIQSAKQDKIDLIQSAKQDKIDLMRAIYITGIIQFLAIIGALLGILSFFMKHA